MDDGDHIPIDTEDEEDFEDEDSETETETEDEEDEYDEAEELEELIRVELTRHSVSRSIADGRTLQGTVVVNNGLPDNSNDFMSCDGNSGDQTNGGGDGRKEESNRDQIDGLICPICYEAWTSSGEHHICCLPCGHLYGLSCIKNWLQRGPNSRKCPQCNGFCRLKDIRVLYAARLCVADEQLHKEFIDRVREVNEALREKLEREMEEKMKKLSKKIEERFEKVERDLEEIKKQTMFDQNQQQNGNFPNTTNATRETLCETQIHQFRGQNFVHLHPSPLWLSSFGCDTLEASYFGC